ncbi:MAG: alpha/beta hydrolase [Pseudomonadota bacterium]
MKKLTALLLLVFYLTISNSTLAQTPARLQKTAIGGDLYNFENYKSFDEYALKYRSYITKMRPNLNADEVANLAPLTLRKTNKSCQKTIGILLIHGLGDSPFLMSDLAKTIADNQSCITLKSLILPGNGLTAGASLEVSDKNWQEAVNFAIADFQNEKVNGIVAIGFSTGGALVLNQVLNHNKDIIAAAFFSPAFDIGISKIQVIGLKAIDFISNFKPLNFLAYQAKHDDVNIYKYESFSYRGINNLYKIIQINNQLLAQNKIINIPTFFAFSDVDSTVKSATTIALINNNFTNAQGIIFSNDGVKIKPEITTLKPINLTKKIIDLSHGSIPISGANYFYGHKAKTNYGCLKYDTKTTQDEFISCKNFDKKFYYGETTKYNMATYKDLSRITYNPDYKAVATKLNGFINQLKK